MRISELINGSEREPSAQANGISHSTLTSLGLLTKTLTRSPVIRWILPARIRHKNKNDIVFVGEDFIEIKQIEKDGHLTHIATKADFDHRIVSAKVLGDAHRDADDMTDDLDIKAEDYDMSSGSHPESTRLPPQCLVLALASQQLVFMFACEDSDGFIGFEMASNVPLPAFSDPSRQLGRHLAVDPASRAVAIAAAQDHVYLYSVAPIVEGAKWGPGFLPISCERPLGRIKGTIMQMEFLYPPDDDPDHVNLLLIVVCDGKTSLIRVDWHCSAGIQAAQYHNALPISKGVPIPNLLIPIKSSGAFVLTTGSDVSVYTGILTGGLQGPHKVNLPQSNPKRPGSSPFLPRWVAWARPIRGGILEDHVYLAREDGDVFYIALNKYSPEDGIGANHVHDFGCFIDSAFTCYGNIDQSDFFAICADMSVGGIHSISPLQMTKSRMGADLVSVLPNWTPTSDLIASNLPRNSDGTVRSRDALFTSGGRQPYGKLSELRFGIEARSGVRFQADVLPSIVQLWTLPIRSEEQLMVLMTSPNGSRVLRIPPNISDRLPHLPVDHPDQPSIVEVVEDVGLDFESRTLAAGMIADDCIMQITERGISISRSGQYGLLNQNYPSDSRVSAAAIDEEHDVAITAVRCGNQSFVSLVQVAADETTPELVQIGAPISSDQEFVSIVIFKSLVGLIAVLGTADSSLFFYGLSPQDGPTPILEYTITGACDTPSACGDIIMLSDAKQRNSASTDNLMLLCGLRDGTLYALGLCLNIDGTLSVSSSQRFTLGLTSVKLNSDGSTRTGLKPGGPSLTAFATSGNDFFKIDWNGAGSKELSISDIWVSDVNEPTLQQGTTTSFAMVPPVDFLRPLAGSLILTSGSEGFITNLESLPKVVPRSLPVEGAPNRGIYSRDYGCFITLGTEYSVHASPRQHSSECRSLRPVVHFKATGTKTWEHIHRLEPGMRVFSITEWNYKDENSGKRYVFILLGSGPIDDKTLERGEITLLHPKFKDGSVVDVRARRVKSLEHSILSLAPYGERGLIACTNPWTYLFEYDPASSRFIEVCKFHTTSPGVYVTTEPPLIRISTSDDSLITLRHDADRRILEPVGLDSLPRRTVHHLNLSIPLASQPSRGGNLNILTTRDRSIVGQTSPQSTTSNMTATMTTLFEAKLSRSMIRLKLANIRPPWKPAHVAGVLEDRLVGTAVDGTVTGLAVLEPGLAHRLRWVQRLCERNAIICPLAPRHSMMTFDHGWEEEDEFLIPPLGFGGPMERFPLVLPRDMHVNGDVLQRMMDRGGAVFLREMLEDEQLGKDRLADWIRGNIEAQLGLVDVLVAEVKSVLDRWW